MTNQLDSPPLGLSVPMPVGVLGVWGVRVGKGFGGGILKLLKFSKPSPRLPHQPIHSPPLPSSIDSCMQTAPSSPTSLPADPPSSSSTMQVCIRVGVQAKDPISLMSHKFFTTFATSISSLPAIHPPPSIQLCQTQPNNAPLSLPMPYTPPLPLSIPLPWAG